MMTQRYAHVQTILPESQAVEVVHKNHFVHSLFLSQWSLEKRLSAKHSFLRHSGIFQAKYNSQSLCEPIGSLEDSITFKNNSATYWGENL